MRPPADPVAWRTGALCESVRIPEGFSFLKGFGAAAGQFPYSDPSSYRDIRVFGRPAIQLTVVFTIDTHPWPHYLSKSSWF